MHLVTLRAPAGGHPGIVVGDDVLDLVAAAPIVPTAKLVPPSMKALLEGGDEALDLVRRVHDRIAGNAAFIDELRDTGLLVPRAKARLLAPIPDPGTIIAAGLNSHEHLKEMNTPVPKQPAHLYKNPSAVIGPDGVIVPPADAADMVDWEGEFSAVFGRYCHRVKAKDALAHIAGYTLINDVSARNWVAPIFAAQGAFPAIGAWEVNILGKQFPTFCPLGPAIATRDEIPDLAKVELSTRVNGERMQHQRMDDLVFGLPELIEYYSRFYAFRPGDVITTGSPSGVGYGRNPKVFMKAGDVVEVHVKEIGTLRNTVGAPR